MIILVNQVFFMVCTKIDHIRAYLAPFFNSYRLTEYGMYIAISLSILALISVLFIYSGVLFLSDLIAQGIGPGIASYSGRMQDVFLALVNETFICISDNDPGVLISLMGRQSPSIGIENTLNLGVPSKEGPKGGRREGGKKARALFNTTLHL